MNKDTQSWSNSNLTEMEELLQKVQQLETENAALHRLIDDPNAMHSHYLRKCNGWEVWQAERIHWFQETVDKLERENAALREALIITTERLSHYVRVPVPVAPGLYATSAEEKASLEVIVKAEEILYPKAKP